MDTIQLRTSHYCYGIIKSAVGLNFALCGGLLLAGQRSAAMPLYFLLIFLLLCQVLSYYACSGGGEKSEEFQKIKKNSFFLKSADNILRFGILVMAVELLIKYAG